MDSHLKPGGPRVLTVFVYLTDVEEGGGTRFDWFDMQVMPKMGRVTIWPSVLDEDPQSIDKRTDHEAMPVIKGQKFGANAWLHLRNFKKADEMDC
jgi:prolyl 4-hydroxylase